MAKLTAAEEQAMMEAFLADQAMYGAYSTLPSINPDIQDLQGDFFTTGKQGATLAADPSFLMTNDLIDYGAYDPLTSFEPVETPGASLLAKWRSGNPYQQWAASQFDTGQPVSTMLAQLSRMVAQPADETQQEIVSYLPPGFRYDEITGESTQTGPDLRLIGDELRGVETAIFNDPQNTVIDPTTGLPSTVTTEDSPMMKKLRSLGYVNTPGVGYDPYSFAPAGVTPETDAATEAAKAAAKSAQGRSLLGYDAERRRAGEADDSYRRFLQMMEAPPLPAAVVTPQPPDPNRAGLGEVPERGGLADDAARFIDSPGEHLGNFFSRLPGRVSRIPGAVSGRTEAAAGALDRTVGNRVEGAAGALDSQFGNTLEEMGSGRRGIGTGGSYGGTTYRLPDFLTGNGQGGGPLGSGPGASLVAANSGGGAGVPQEPGTPWGSQGFGGAASNMVKDVLIEGMKQKMLKQQAAAHQASIQHNTDVETFRHASQAAASAKRHAQARQAMVRQMTARGQTPFGDEVQRRMSGIYGMGM